MFKKRLLAKSLKQSKMDFANLFNLMSVATDIELAGNLATAHMVKWSLTTEAPTGFPFPKSELDGLVDTDNDHTKSILSQYNFYLQSLRSKNSDPSLASTRILHSGLTIWILSIRSLITTELFPDGRRMWSNLLSAKDCWLGVITEYWPSSIEISDFRELWYVPKQLVPSNTDCPLVN